MIDVSFNNIGATMKRICGNKDVGQFMADTCQRYMTKYVPFETGVLRSVDVIDKPFKVTYYAPYAKKQFNGNYDHSKSKNPIATSHWDKATQCAFSTQIAKEVSQYIAKR